MQATSKQLEVKTQSILSRRKCPISYVSARRVFHRKRTTLEGKIHQERVFIIGFSTAKSGYDGQYFCLHVKFDFITAYTDCIQPLTARTRLLVSSENTLIHSSCTVTSSEISPQWKLCHLLKSSNFSFRCIYL